MTVCAPSAPFVPSESPVASKPIELPRGLSQARAAELLERDGPNEILLAAPPSPLRMFGRQFQSPVVGLLLAACGVAALLGEILDGAAIGVVVILNALVGFPPGVPSRGGGVLTRLPRDPAEPMIGRAEWLTLASTRRIFRIEALSAADFLLVGGFALLPVTLVELSKVLRVGRADQ
jgi:hypothetical protein